MSGDAWGIASGYHDDAGRWHDTPAASAAAIRAAMGAPADGSGAPPASDTVVIRRGDPFHVGFDAELLTEDGGTVPLAGGSPLPTDLDPGYHQLFDRASGAVTTVILTPEACPLPLGLRTWGWAVQLYSLRSKRSWGHGDFADLATLNRWSATEHGAGMVLVNPLHAPAPVLRQQPSPYFPTSRVYRNPLYLHLEDVPGYADLAADLAVVAARGRSLNADRRIERDEVFRCKYDALERLWTRFRARSGTPEHAAFAAYEQEQGTLLRDFATFSALVERRPDSWRRWPAAWHRPTSAAVARFRDEHADRVRFHAWVQWLVDRQLATAGRGLDLMTDLAIGVDRGGADAWMWQDSFALDLSVGAPPDDFNRRGQDWGLPPLDPWRLRANGYEPFVQTVRAALRHAGGLRIDHVMGLFRLYWIPEAASPADGAYVYLPHHDLLGIVALEASRAGAYVVGEDLGTVEDYVRAELAERRILSYRLLQFEPGPAAELPAMALAAVTTHDLPTIAGYWTGADVRNQQAIGLDVNEDGMRHIRRQLAARAGLDADALDDPDGPADTADDPGVDRVVLGVYEELATAPCALLNATLDDVLGVEERPNMPGTIDEWPNWRIALPTDLDTILEDPRVAAVAEALRARRSR